MRFWTRRNWLTLAALAGLICVAMGAFAAHGLSDAAAKEWMRTGAQYGFVHVLATFACAGLMQAGARRARFAPACFLAGVGLFCGSLWAMALGGPRWLGALTPLGGLAFLAGWAVLVWAARGVEPDA